MDLRLAKHLSCGGPQFQTFAFDIPDKGEACADMSGMNWERLTFPTGWVGAPFPNIGGGRYGSQQGQWECACGVLT